MLGGGMGVFGQTDDARQGKNQGAGEKIADAVDEVKGKPGGDPGKHARKIEAEQQRLGRCVQNAVQKAVGGADHHVNDGLDFGRDIPGQQHDRAPKHCPDIKIGDPPGGKAAEQPGEEHKGEDGIEGSISTFEAYIRPPSIPKTAISLMVSLMLFFHPQGIGGVLFNFGGIYARHGVFAVDVESPVSAVNIVVGSDAVDRFDIEAVVALFTLNEFQLLQGGTYGGLVGADVKNDLFAFGIGYGKFKLFFPLAQGAVFGIKKGLGGTRL